MPDLFGPLVTFWTGDALQIMKKLPTGSVHKQLIGIPWLVAFALQADGWYLRQDIVWHKTNPMPESVKDRCTRAHEFIFMFSKSPRYYYDYEAIQEPAIYANCNRKSATAEQVINGKGPIPGQPRKSSFRAKRSVWSVSTKAYKGAHFATFPPDLIEPCILAGSPVGGVVLDPFSGAGTTGLVARRNGRDAVLIDLNAGYNAIAQERMAAHA